jgi:hypothetical protein
MPVLHTIRVLPVIAAAVGAALGTTVVAYGVSIIGFVTLIVTIGAVVGIVMYHLPKEF